MHLENTDKSNGFEKIGTRRIALTAVILVLAFVIILGIVHSPITKVGSVEYKFVTGVSEGKLYIIHTSSNGGHAFADTLSETLTLAEKTNPVVSGSAEKETGARFSDVRYRVSIRQCSNDETATYFVTKTLFNELRVGDIVIFEIERSQRDSLRRLVQDEHNQPIGGINHRPYMPSMTDIHPPVP